MALVQRKISKGKQIRLAAALAAVIATTALVAYYGLLRRPVAVDAPSAPAGNASGPAGFAIPNQTGFEAARELSESPFFRTLRSFGAWPLSRDPVGNRSLFLLREK